MTTATHQVAGPGEESVEVTVTDVGTGQPFLLLHGGAGPQSVPPLESSSPPSTIARSRPDSPRLRRNAAAGRVDRHPSTGRALPPSPRSLHSLIDKMLSMSLHSLIDKMLSMRLLAASRCRHAGTGFACRCAGSRNRGLRRSRFWACVPSGGCGLRPGSAR